MTMLLMWVEGSLFSAVGVKARRSSYRLNMYPKMPTANTRTATTAAIVPQGLGLAAVTTGRALRTALLVLPLGIPNWSSLTMGPAARPRRQCRDPGSTPGEPGRPNVSLDSQG